MLTGNQSILFEEPNEIVTNIIRTQFRIQVILRPSSLRKESELIEKYYREAKKLVIHLDFSKINGNSCDAVMQSYINYMATIYKEFYEHVKLHLSIDACAEYLGIMDSKLDLFGSSTHCLLKNLIEILYDTTKSSVVVIIENIDYPVHCARGEDISALYEFFGSVYEASFKGNHEIALYKALLTGTLPVSTPNNINMNNLFNAQFRNHVESLRHETVYANIIPNVPLISYHYETTINYLLKKNNEAGNSNVVKDGLMSLLNGETIKATSLTIDCRYNYSKNKDYKPGDVWRTLYFLGLLTLNTSTITSDNQVYVKQHELNISNEQSKRYIQEHLNSWLHLLSSESRINLEL